MPSPAPLTGTLEKLTIVAFSDAKMTKFNGSFVSMFNPSSFTVNSSNAFDEAKETGGGKSDQKLSHREPRSLSFELFLDGTNASPVTNYKGPDLSRFGITKEEAARPNFNAANQLNSDTTGDTVTKCIDSFLEMAYFIDGEQHRPSYLAVIWGTFLFPCVLESANVTYSLFQTDGKPIRAKISVSAKEHITKLKLNKILRLESPDLSHYRRIYAGDTIHNLAEKFYGDSSLYLQLAAANNLTNYRKLKPGTQLIFPPIEKIKGRA